MTSPYLYSEDTWRGFFARLRREDPEEIEDLDRFIIDRARPRQHLSFGFGVHRCVGNRLAEMQLTILWEEILKRFPPIEVVERPKRAYSNLINGITEMKVRIPV
jgi:cytochrome P450